MAGNGQPMDPMRAQTYRTQRAELPEDLWQPLYDRVNYAAAGTSALGFFSQSRGQSATLLSTVAAGVWTAASKVKTFRDTNIENSNVVPTKMFKVVGCSVGFLHANQNATNCSRDREIIRGGSYLQFRIVDKDIIFLPLITIPEMNPIGSSTANSVNATAGGGGQNVPMYKFPIPITINPYENFTVQLNLDNSPPIDQTMDIYLMLHALTDERLIVVMRLANSEYRRKPEMVTPRHSCMKMQKVVTTTKEHLPLAA